MVKPLRDNVVIKQQVEEETKAGLIITSTGQQPQGIGEVIAIGSDVVDINVGDKVLYTDYAADPFTVNEEKLILIKSTGILGIIET